jgi:carbamoylphosphate synthase large subunit
MKENKPRALLIGSSFSAMPVLIFLKKQGYHVSVCGGLKSDPCHIYAHQSFYVDYSNRDDLLDLLKSNNFDFIIPTCNDYSYNAASFVSTSLNQFHGFDTDSVTTTLHSKNDFKSFLIKNKIPTPKILKNITKDDLRSSSLSYPLLVKPDDSFSGKGITKIHKESELSGAVIVAEKYSRSGNIVIEEFVSGNLYSHSAFIQDGAILVDFFVDEYCTTYPYQVNSSCISHVLSEDIKNNIRRNIHKIIKKLSLSDGLLHTQFIADNINMWIIETMRRCPGDLYGALIEKSTGFDYTRFYCNPFLNIKNIKNLKKNKTRYIARHTVSSVKKSIFRSFKCKAPLDNGDIFPLKKSGETLEKAPYDKAAIVFHEFETEGALLLNAPNIVNYIEIKTMDKGDNYE